MIIFVGAKIIAVRRPRICVYSVMHRGVLCWSVVVGCSGVCWVFWFGCCGQPSPNLCTYVRGGGLLFQCSVHCVCSTSCCVAVVKVVGRSGNRGSSPRSSSVRFASLAPPDLPLPFPNSPPNPNRLVLLLIVCVFGRVPEALWMYVSNWSLVRRL